MDRNYQNTVRLSHLYSYGVFFQALGVSSQSDRSTIKKKLKDMRKAQEKLEKQREKKEKEGRRSGRLPLPTDSVCWGISSALWIKASHKVHCHVEPWELVFRPPGFMSGCHSDQPSLLEPVGQLGTLLCKVFTVSPCDSSVSLHSPNTYTSD